MSTPQPSVSGLAAVIGVPELYLKREDLHPYGSHKGRSIPVMIETYAKKGVTNFVISSSGNAALAAIHAVKKYNQEHPNACITLTVYVGKHIDREKLKNIEYLIAHIQSIKIVQVDRPKQAAFQEAKKTNIIFLRQSTDDAALLGYAELAKELAEIPNLSAVFIPTSSGTTAQAIGEWFLGHNKSVEIHIVQAQHCRPIVDYINHTTEFVSITNPNGPFASAIVDHIGHRKEQLEKIVRRTHGTASFVSDQKIQKTIILVKKESSIDISPNSALSVAGLIHTVQTGWRPHGAVACLITGA